MPKLQTHGDFYPDYPEDWIDVTEEARQDYLLPTHVANVPSHSGASYGYRSNGG